MNWYKKAQNQYLTKDGMPISFGEFPFSENNDRRGWVVHDIKAYVDGEYAGYIKFSYISHEKWESIYNGNIWKFRNIALGHYDIPEELFNASDEEIAKDHKEKYPWSNGEYFVESEREKAEREYRMYYLYFVDKPIVDFIRTNEKFQRQKVALALHEYANQWLKDNFGLKLWLSYCRTDMGKCFYDAKLLELKKYRYREKMTGGFRQEREHMAFNKKNLKISYKTILTSDEMIDFILDNALQDWQGKLDFNEAKDIARASKQWILKEMPLNLFNWETDPSIKNPLPPIILDVGDGDYEVLDGVHRIGAAKSRSEKFIMAYVGSL